MIAVGIDGTLGSQAFQYAALASDLRLVHLDAIELDEVVSRLRDADPPIFVAINSPSRVNAGIVRQRMQAQARISHGLRGVELREAEYVLHSQGLAVTATPRLASLCASWVQQGFRLYQRLADLDYKPFPAKGAQNQWLETHPHAGFSLLLGRAPMPKPTLEGRLQRALVLFENGVRIHDPMTFLEEITRHRLLHGMLPIEQVLRQEQLDALLAAYTAWLAATQPSMVSQVGNDREGFITLPVSPLEIQSTTS